MGVNVSAVLSAGAAPPADTLPSPTSSLVTATRTFAVGSLFSFTRKVRALPTPLSCTLR